MYNEIFKFIICYIVIPLGGFALISYFVAFIWLLTNSQRITDFYSWAINTKKYNPCYHFAVLSILFIYKMCGLEYLDLDDNENIGIWFERNIN